MKTRTKIIIVLFLLWLFWLGFFLDVKAVSGTTLFQNHSFETSTSVPPAGWTDSCSDAGTESISQTSPVPDGKNKLRISMDSATVIGSCTFFQEVPNPTISWRTAIQYFQFYSRITSIGSGDCVIDNCWVRIEVGAFNDEGALVSYIVTLLDSLTEDCVPNPWESGGSATFCFNVPGSCLNKVSTNFCLYRDTDFFNHVENLCGENCLTQISQGTNPTIQIIISASLTTNNIEYAFEVDDVFVGLIEPSQLQQLIIPFFGVSVIAVSMIVIGSIASRAEHGETVDPFTAFFVVVLMFVGVAITLVGIL